MAFFWQAGKDILITVPLVYVALPNPTPGKWVLGDPTHLPEVLLRGINEIGINATAGLPIGLPIEPLVEVVVAGSSAAVGLLASTEMLTSISSSLFDMPFLEMWEQCMPAAWDEVAVPVSNPDDPASRRAAKVGRRNARAPHAHGSLRWAGWPPQGGHSDIW